MPTYARIPAPKRLAAGVVLALMACSSGTGTDLDMPNPRASAVPTSISIPALDAELPAEIQTATFALG